MHPIARFTRSAVAVAVTVTLGAGASAAHAKPLEHFSDHFEGTFHTDTFCGDLSVRTDVVNDSKVLARETGPDRIPRYTVVHRGGHVYTNLATGKAMTDQFDYISQDVRLTDNGDGTLTIVYQTPGAGRHFGPDGRLVLVDAHPSWYQAVVDTAGTPEDPSDDTLISDELIRSVASHVDDDFCDVFRAVTS